MTIEYLLLDIVFRPLCIVKNVLNFTKRKYFGHFGLQAPIGRRNAPHHSYIAVYMLVINFLLVYVILF